MKEQEILYQFISTVVKNEMDNTQQSIFELEGRELIEQLFQKNGVITNTREGLGLDVYLSSGVNEINSLLKIALEVGPFIVSVLTLYLTFKRDKRSEKMEELKLLKERWKSQLILEEKIDPNIAELIVNKYSTQLLEIIK